MPPPALELADIFRLHGPAYRQAHDLPWQQQRLMQAIENCRTPALGSVVECCSQCQYTHIQYRSCRNRHCPKCQGLARARWLQQRQAELLPVDTSTSFSPSPNSLPKSPSTTKPWCTKSSSAPPRKLC